MPRRSKLSRYLTTHMCLAPCHILTRPSPIALAKLNHHQSIVESVYVHESMYVVSTIYLHCSLDGNDFLNMYMLPAKTFDEKVVASSTSPGSMQR